MPSFKERYEDLNDEQKEVVAAIDGPVLVVAGPGSGKTEVLSLRVANILKNTDTHPSSIICLTYTDSAAINMRQRLAQLIGRDAYRVAIYTFHGFSVDVINRYPEYFYEGALFMPADDFTRIEVLEGVLADLDHDSPLKKTHPEQGYTYLKAIKSDIEYLKKAGLTPNDFKLFLEKNTEAFASMSDLLTIFDATVSKKLFPKYEEIIGQLDALVNDEPLPGFSPLAKAVGNSLREALAKAKEEDRGTPISQWKTEYIKKDESGRRVLRDTLYAEKLTVLANVYEKYMKRMHDRGYYDFDDMLLDVLRALKHNKSLGYDLQERFQYILLTFA